MIIIKNIEKAITQSKHTNYIVVNSFILRNIVENIISISNKAQNDKVYIEQIYVILNYIYGTTKEESKKKFLDSGSVFLQLIKTLNHAHISHINSLERKEEELR
ncbi:MAG: hypothetical protein KBF13_09480 [Prevotella sp.]|nr:hypothetical protein [Prevotella sp.]